MYTEETELQLEHVVLPSFILKMPIGFKCQSSFFIQGAPGCSLQEQLCQCSISWKKWAHCQCKGESFCFQLWSEMNQNKERKRKNKGRGEWRDQKWREYDQNFDEEPLTRWKISAVLFSSYFQYVKSVLLTHFCSLFISQHWNKQDSQSVAQSVTVPLTDTCWKEGLSSCFWFCLTIWDTPVPGTVLLLRF